MSEKSEKVGSKMKSYSGVQSCRVLPIKKRLRREESERSLRKASELVLEC
jgi:hypothetical protein